jgi:hypothetical protein
VILARSMTAAALLVLCASVASAAPALATRDVNMRQGPGTSYPVVTTIPGGSTVDISGCQAGWCTVAWQGHSGYSIARSFDQGNGSAPGAAGPPPAAGGAAPPPAAGPSGLPPQPPPVGVGPPPPPAASADIPVPASPPGAPPPGYYPPPPPGYYPPPPSYYYRPYGPYYPYGPYWRRWYW